jgi:hypothetical protein
MIEKMSQQYLEAEVVFASKNTEPANDCIKKGYKSLNRNNFR